MAHVLLVSGADTLAANTDLDGFFSFLMTPSYDVWLMVSYVGYEKQSRKLNVLSDLSVDIIMNPSTVQLGDVVVEARSTALAGNSEQGTVTLNSKKLDKIPSVLGVPDMIRILQLMPGVQNSGETNGYLYVRGADPGHNLMLYNDVPVYGMSHLLGIFPFYNADHIDRIHFDKSGNKAQYGNRLGATVQALTPDRLPDSLSVKGNIGLVASQATISCPLGKKAAVVFSGRQTYIDQIITPLLNQSDDEDDIDDLGYSFSDANLTLLFKPNEKHDIDINAFISSDHFSIAEDRMLLDGKLKWSNHLASASWTWTTPGITFKHFLYLSEYANKLRIEQASINLSVQSKVMDWGFHSSAGFTVMNIPFTAGVQFADYHVRPQEITSSQLSNVGNINRVNASQISAYVQARPQLNDYLHLDMGLRTGWYSNNGKNTDFRLEPGISLNYSTPNKFNAYLSYARKSQYLHLITTSSVGIPTDFWIATSEGVPVEQADIFSAGTGYKMRPQLEITTGLFYSRLHNLAQYPFSIIQFNEITSFGEDLYTGKGKSYGAELMIKKTGRLSGWISYTLSKSDRQFDEIDNGQAFPSKFDRRHNLSLVANYEISERWSAGLTQIYASGSRFTAPTSWYFINNNPVKEYGRYNNAQMPDYVRTDISVDFFIRKTTRRESVLNLSVYNLLAVDNPIYVILDISASPTGNRIKVKPRYQKLYTILPSIGWRFKF